MCRRPGDVSSTPGSTTLASVTNENDIAATPAGDASPVNEIDTPKAPLWRRILSIVLAIVAIVAILLSLVVAWEKTILKNEDQFVTTFEDLPSNDAVATVLSARVAERIVERSGVNDFVVRVLPDPLEFLAAPLTATISATIEDTAHDVITSDGFTDVWAATLRVTHRSVSAILSGNGDVISTEGGTVAIDLDAIADAAIARVENRGLSLPNLDIEFGEIVLYESEQLATAQSIASLTDTLGWLVPLAALILIAAALWAAPDRRWMVSFLGFGTALAVLIQLAALRTGRNTILGGIGDETAREAGSFVWQTVTEVLVQAAWALLALSLVIGFVAWVLGPSRHARVLSGWTRDTIERWGQPENTERSALSEFFTRWKRTVEIGIVVLAALFVLLGPVPTVLSVLATAIVAGAFIGAVEIVAGPSTEADTDLKVDA